MTNNLIESFLKYEEQRKAQKNPNEFQSVKNLQERNIIRRSNKDEPASAATPPVGAGEALRPEIARNSYDVNRAAPEQGPPVSAMARPGDTRFGNFNSNGTVSGNTSVTAARAGVRTEPEPTPPEQGPSISAMARPGDTRFGNFNSNGTVKGSTVTGNATAARAGAKPEPEVRTTGTVDPVRAAVDSGAAMRTPGADMSVTNSGGDQVSVIPGRTSDGEPLTRGLQRDGQPMIGPEGKNTDTPAPPAPPATPARPNDGNNGVSAPSERALNTRPGLRAGPASTNTIKALQSHLGITADGIAGPQTRQAVMKFQREHGLQVDGIIGDQTRMAFERSLANRRNESVQFSEAQMTQRPSTGAAGREALTLRNRPASAAARMLAPSVATPEPAPEQGPSISAMARPGDTRFGNFNSNGTVRGSTVTGNATAARAGVRTEPEAIDPVRAAANAGLSMTTPGADMSVTNSGGDQVSVIPGRKPDGTPLTKGQQDGGQRMMGPEPEGRNTDTPAPPAPPAPPATPARPNDGNNRVSAPSQSTLNTRPGLKAGPASADTVKAFQRELGITADGVAGPQTRQAVMDFQRKHGLQVDGIIGDQTRMAFERSMANYRTESVQFSEAELAHFKSILEAMPVAPTAEGHGPNPTPKNKAEGGKGRGSLSEMKKK